MTLVLGVLALVVGIARAEEPTLQTGQLVLDLGSIESMVRIHPPEVLTVTVVASKAEEAERLARVARLGQVLATQPPTAQASVESDVAFEQKRALTQAAAAAHGIDWKILEAVWQVESGKRWTTAVRSPMGAQGPMQFMPGTWRAYATDGNGDGQMNVAEAEDAVYAAAKLLAANGAAENIDRALLAYNHAQWYVQKVKKIAASIEG